MEQAGGGGMEQEEREAAGGGKEEPFGRAGGGGQLGEAAWSRGGEGWPAWFARRGPAVIRRSRAAAPRGPGRGASSAEPLLQMERDAMASQRRRISACPIRKAS